MPIDSNAKNAAAIASLIEVMETLLGPDGCPWDKEQTLESLRAYVIEEAHEVAEAIDSGRPEALREELGDLLFQVIFQTALTKRSGWFDFADVATGISEKMIRRHPWVFGDEEAADSADASLARWEAMKAKEKKDRGALGGVPVSLPALLRALRVGEKAAASGYDWPNAQAVRAKLDEEIAELDEAIASNRRDAIEDELGDALFTLASLARKHDVDPEAALRGALQKFSARFRHAELAAQATNRRLPELSDEERDLLWEAAKEAGK